MIRLKELEKAASTPTQWRGHEFTIIKPSELIVLCAALRALADKEIVEDPAAGGMMGDKWLGLMGIELGDEEGA